MRIDKSQIKISFDFTPTEYFLCKVKDKHEKMLGDYSLNYRIDRSEKGKDDDIGMPKIFLSEEEAQQCRENGFSEII